MADDHLPLALRFANERAERWKVRYDELLARLPEAKAEAWDEGHMLGEALAYNAAGDVLWERHREVLAGGAYREARIARAESLPHWNKNPYRD